jgi:hypothetical protein
MGNDGEPPPESEFLFACDEVEQEIRDGISGGDWYSGESDTPQYCEGCGCLLRFCLTSYGVSYTYEGFEADKIDSATISNPDAVYELCEMLERGAWSTHRREIAALKATAKAALASQPRGQQ